MDEDKEIFEEIYDRGAVWTETNPPEELINLVESGRIKPFKVLDVGCGEGFYSIYLASKGFEVTGIDLSENAIKSAKKNALNKKLNIKFEVFDAVRLNELKRRFDFVLEWAVLHHIMPEERQKYIEGINTVLNNNGTYLSVCFNDKNPDFGMKGKKLRIVPEGSKMPAGSRLYYSPFEEVEKLFKTNFKILESKEIIMTTGGKEHIANYFFMKKI